MGSSIFVLKIFTALLAATIPSSTSGTTATGALVETIGQPPTLMMLTQEKLLKIPVANGAEIKRGHVGADTLPAAISELEIGDRITAVLDTSGAAVSVSAIYKLTAGEVRSIHGSKVLLTSGELIEMNPSARLLGKNGESISLESVKRGDKVSIKSDPTTEEGWRLTAGVQTTQSTPTETKPVITTISHNAESKLRLGDVVYIKMTGTPGIDAFCEIGKAKFSLAETSPGTYEGIWTAPATGINNAPVVGVLQRGKEESKRVQAARLISVAAGTVQPVSTTVNKQKSEPVTTAPQVEPKAVKKPIVLQQQPVKKPQVVVNKQPEASVVKITRPKPGEKVIDYLIVKGNAPSGSKVGLKVEYSNGLTGILRLAGIAAQEEVTSDAQGQFSSSHIKLSKHLSSPGLNFTITAIAIDRNGQESQPSIVKAYGRAF